MWTARSNLTNSYADRSADGTWTTVDRLTGNRVPLPEAPFTSARLRQTKRHAPEQD
ncbi:hypothetical protein [Kitasatospora sp. NBC_01300]|uniref:hypothetical protein n=1 Tax=Kitasatospora sp. NBC_01300 TaxID=2903574 RepID=UPI002F910EA8|nr:hypothetical protein OG556_40845 [Kitasatospora sp. NBC_01300]